MEIYGKTVKIETGEPEFPLKSWMNSEGILSYLSQPATPPVQVRYVLRYGNVDPHPHLWYLYAVYRRLTRTRATPYPHYKNNVTKAGILPFGKPDCGMYGSCTHRCNNFTYFIYFIFIYYSQVVWLWQKNSDLLMCDWLNAIHPAGCDALHKMSIRPNTVLPSRIWHTPRQWYEWLSSSTVISDKF
jgi:hypothetical protein